MGRRLLLTIGFVLFYLTINLTPGQLLAQEGDVSLEGLRRVASFESRESADRLAENLRGDGYDAVVLDDIDETGKKIFFVFAGLPEDEAAIPVPMAGETVATISSEVLGKRERIIHPFISITETYTDNVYNTDEDHEGDYVTILSAGLWIAKNAGRERLLAMGTTPVYAGGLTVSRLNDRTFRRYKIFFQYQFDYAHFRNNESSEDTVSHKVNALLQYNFRGGHTLSLIDQWVLAYSKRGEGDTGKYDELGRYTTNHAGAIAFIDLTEKLKLKAEYANFIVDYDLARDSFRNRIDNYFSGYVIFRIMPKTSLFLQGSYVDIDYDGGMSLDGQESHFFAGVSWEITAKSIGSLKGGYGIKEFDDPSLETAEYVIAEAQLSHRFTPKTSLSVSASRKTGETDIEGASHILGTTFSAGLSYKIKPKVSTSVSASYVKTEYKDSTTGGGSVDRVDDLFSAGITFNYAIKRWLTLSAGYTYSTRESSDGSQSYSSNTYFIKAVGRM